MKDKAFIGIDTSNYTTSLALCTSDGNVLLNLKKLLDVGKGERGLRQSDAVFQHVRNMPVLCEQAADVIEGYDIAAVGYSSRPRDLADSYMPCFLAGKNTAFGMASVLHVPIYDFSHQNGHIMAAAYSSGRSDELLSEDFCAFHVSGGTTEILRVTVDKGSGEFSVKIVGGTRDLNAGQAIDRTGVAMGLKFPCGREMELLAADFCGDVPKPKISVSGLECNLSGLESLAKKLYSDSGDRSAVSRYVFDFLSETFIVLTQNLLDRYPGARLLYAGGVMSNNYIKSKLSERFDAGFATPEFSADNAAGIALLCRKKYMFKNGSI